MANVDAEAGGRQDVPASWEESLESMIRERAKIPAFPDNAVPTQPGVMAASSSSVPSS